MTLNTHSITVSYKSPKGKVAVSHPGGVIYDVLTCLFTFSTLQHPAAYMGLTQLLAYLIRIRSLTNGFLKDFCKERQIKHNVSKAKYRQATRMVELTTACYQYQKL